MKCVDIMPARGQSLGESYKELPELSLGLVAEKVNVQRIKEIISKMDHKQRYCVIEGLVDKCHNMHCSQRYHLRRNVQNLLRDQDFEYKHELAEVWLNHPETSQASEKGRWVRKVSKRFENTQLAMLNLNVEQLSATFCEKLVNIACSNSSYKEAIQIKIRDILNDDPSSNPNLAPIQSKLAEAWEKQTIEKPSEIESEITNLASNHTYDPGNKGLAF